jgi:hypothetical protein
MFAYSGEHHGRLAFPAKFHAAPDAEDLEQDAHGAAM